MKPITRDSFIFYRSFFCAISHCPDKVQLELFRAVVGYALDNVPPCFSECQERPFMAAIWDSIKPQLDANTQRYVNGCKGGAPKGSHNNPQGRKGKVTNQELTKNKPNVNENDNGNANDNIPLPFSSREFVDTWKELRRQPKWKNKTKAALTRAIAQLSEYEEGFAVVLMNNAIINGYQGLVYSTTPNLYEQWKRTRHAATAAPGKVITRVEDLF